MTRSILVTLTALCFVACHRSPQTTTAPPTSPTPNPALESLLNPKRNTEVDSLHGFADFTLGAAEPELKGLLRPFYRSPSDFGDYVVTYSADASALPDTLKQWAGVPIESLWIEFQGGHIRLIRVNFDPDQIRLFTRAFELKFGQASRDEVTVGEWLGDDTRVTIYWLSKVEMMSATSDRICTEECSKLKQRARESLDAKARKTAERF